MHFSSALLLAAAATAASAQATFSRSSKRGLCFVPSEVGHVADNQIWVESGSDLSWYYNYKVQPSTTYANRTQAEFEFVPMLWSTSNTFLTDVRALISGGRNITHVLGYNEPDGTAATGGSNIAPSVAAANWISQMEPLRQQGIKLGAPAVTGSPGGFTWLASFADSCASLGTNCTFDFIPIHWYGDFSGLASHMGQVVATYVSPVMSFLQLLTFCSFPNTSLWITEYSLNNQSLEDTQSFFNTSAEYFDRLNFTDRYSYFGAFRSDVSNVGPNVAMLTSNGSLTDIGSWYMGGAATGNIPSSKSASGAQREIVNFGFVAIVAIFAVLVVL